MPGAQDYLDVFFPQQQQQSIGTDPYGWYQQWLAEQQMPTLNDPNVQGIIGLSPARYQGQNANTYLNNAMDFQTAEQGRMLDTAQALAGQQQWEQEYGLKQQAADLNQQEFDAKFGNVQQMSDVFSTMLDPKLLNEAYVSQNPEAIKQVITQIAQQMDPVNGAVTPQVLSIATGIASSPMFVSPEEQAANDRQAASDEKFGNDLADYSQALGQRPNLQAAVRDIVGQSSDQMGMLRNLAANQNPQGAMRATRMARELGDAAFGQRPITHGTQPWHWADALRDRLNTAKAGYAAGQNPTWQQNWQQGPALNRSPEPVVQATQAWNQPTQMAESYMQHPTLTPKQQFELMHSPEAALAASPNRPAPPQAKNNDSSKKSKPSTNSTRANRGNRAS